MKITQKITPCLWFDDQAEEAVKFYLSVFKDSATGRKTLYGKEGYEIHGHREGSVQTVEFTIEGQQFLALNGGDLFKFTEAVSFIINCTTQQEVDYYWDRLREGGDPEAQQCGWLKDRFGVSWQVVPEVLNEMFADPDPVKVDRVMKAMLPMKKLDIAMLKQAFDGGH